MNLHRELNEYINIPTHCLFLKRLLVMVIKTQLKWMDLDNAVMCPAPGRGGGNEKEYAVGRWGLCGGLVAQDNDLRLTEPQNSIMH